MSASRVSLAEVGAKAGCSAATVSRVLNNKDGVSEDTRATVLLALELLGYEPPPQLRRREAGVVGVLVPELGNPIFARYGQALEEALNQHGYSQILCSQSVGAVHEDEHVRRLLQHCVSGLIFVSGIHALTDPETDRYRRLNERGVPLAFVNGPMPEITGSFVANDEVALVDLAMRHLVSLGHRRLGMATGPRRYTVVRRRIDAFVAALHELVPEQLSDVDDLVTSTVFSVEGGAMAAGPLLDAGVTAIVAGSDLMALGAIAQARSRGLRVPDDVSVLGTDDTLLMEFTDPALTCIRQPVTAMAQAAVQGLVAQVAGEAPLSGELIFRPELVVRSSSAPCRAS